MSIITIPNANRFALILLSVQLNPSVHSVKHEINRNRHSQDFCKHEQLWFTCVSPRLAHPLNIIIKVILNDIKPEQQRPISPQLRHRPGAQSIRGFLLRMWLGNSLASRHSATPGYGPEQTSPIPNHLGQCEQNPRIRNCLRPCVVRMVQRSRKDAPELRGNTCLSSGGPGALVSGPSSSAKCRANSATSRNVRERDITIRDGSSSPDSVVLLDELPLPPLARPSLVCACTPFCATCERLGSRGGPVLAGGPPGPPAGGRTRPQNERMELETVLDTVLCLRFKAAARGECGGRCCVGTGASCLPKPNKKAEGRRRFGAPTPVSFDLRTRRTPPLVRREDDDPDELAPSRSKLSGSERGSASGWDRDCGRG